MGKRWHSYSEKNGTIPLKKKNERGYREEQSRYKENNGTNEINKHWEQETFSLYIRIHVNTCPQVVCTPLLLVSPHPSRTAGPLSVGPKHTSPRTVTIPAPDVVRQSSRARADKALAFQVHDNFPSDVNDRSGKN